MREAHNIREVEALKPTMMGFICWEGSSRNIREIPTYLPSCIRVGVFVNPLVGYVRNMARQLRLNRIQLHGDESPKLCQQIIRATGLPIMKAISVETPDDIYKYRPYVGIIDLFLFDTKCKTVGGSGKQFDWEVLQHYDGDTPFLLAGGISPGDERRVLEFRHPRFIGIDVNSRFEVSPGMKDVEALREFVNKIRA